VVILFVAMRSGRSNGSCRDVSPALDAGGSDWHTFLCGQSGSGKTYASTGPSGPPLGLPAEGPFGYRAWFFFRSSISTHSADSVYISPRRMNAPSAALKGRSWAIGSSSDGWRSMLAAWPA
jgi:hypothetical protein